MATIEKTTTERPLAGVIGFFDQPSQLIAAMTKVKEAKYECFDAYTPYPIHGMDEAQGLKRSPLAFVTLAAAITGCILAFSFEYWTSAVDWPLIVGGKPFNSWPAFVPIMFEITVLLGGLSTVAAMFLVNGLPNLKRKSFDPGITRDRFALAIEVPVEKENSEKFDVAEALEFLKKQGATEVRKVYAEGWF